MTIYFLLLILAVVFLIINAIGRLPLWPCVLMLIIIMALNYGGKLPLR